MNIVPKCLSTAITVLLLCASAFGQQIDLTKNVKGVLPRKNGGLGVGAINSYGGSISSASTIAVGCNQSLTVTGATTINTITMSPSVGCAAILIAGAGATWSTGTSGNISAAVTPSVGNAAILVSDGTKFNPGWSNSGGVSLGALQYLQGTPNTLTAGTRAVNLPYLLSSDFAYPAQAPGTVLTGGVPATVTMTPGPLGLDATAVPTNTKVRLSAGTGTAEATLVTGGSCNGTGQPSCTIAFTPANNHTGAWTVTSANAGIQEALNYLPADGGQVWMPSGPINIYATIVLGAGTATAKSERNSMSLIGRGAGRGADVAFPADGGTTLLWTGAAGGTMLRVAGPVGNGTVSDFMMDGQGVADIGLDIVHSYLWTYRKLTIVGWASIGLRSMATDFVFSGMATGNNNNLFDTVIVTTGTGGGSSVACQLGQAVTNTLSIFDFASNMMVNSACLSSAGTGMELRLADNNTFQMSEMFGATGLKFTSPTAGFPGANVFIQCPVGTVTASAGFDLTTTATNWFFPFSNTDSAQDPQTVARFASGVDMTGQWFGIQKNAPLVYAEITGGATITNTMAETAFDRHYLTDAYSMNYLGAVGTVKASGRVATTGTPTLTLTIKLGGVPIGKFAFTCANNATSDGFSIESDFTVRAIGAGAIAVGYSYGIIGGFSGTSTVAATSTVGLQGITFTGTNDLQVFAQWGAASTSNIVSLDTLTLRVEMPRATQ